MVKMINSTKANIKISCSIAHLPPFVDSNSKEWLLCRWSTDDITAQRSAVISLTFSAGCTSDYFILAHYP